MATVLEAIRSRRAVRREQRQILTTDDYAWAVTQAVMDAGISGSLSPHSTTWQNEPVERIGASMEAYASQLYASNGLVFAVMSCRMLAFSLVRMQWQAMRSGRPDKLFGTPSLAAVETPYLSGTTATLLGRSILDADLAGNSYHVRDGGTGVIRLRPDWVQIILMPIELGGGFAGWRKVGYTYHDGGIAACPPEDVAIFTANEVAHWTPYPDPLATFRGMSWLTPVIREIENDKATERHKTRFWENAATPSLSVSLDKTVTPKAFAEFKAAMEVEHTGLDNAYKCLHPDTDVAMWDGRRVPARGVAPGDVLVAWRNGAAVPGAVTAAEWQPPSPIVTVTTQRGRVIRTNDRHPFLVAGQTGAATRWDAPKWIDAADLRPGHLLTTGLGFGDEDTPTDLTRHDAWLLGALTGDGCMVSSTPVVSAWDDGVRGRLGRGHDLRSTGKGHDYRIVGVTKLAREHGLMGARSWEKRIPEAVMVGPATVRAAFLSGLVDTDGHVSDPGKRTSMELGITSVSRELLADAQHLFAALGVNTSLSQCAKPGRYSERGAWRLCAFGNGQAQTLVEVLDLAAAAKRARLAAYAAIGPSNARDSSRYDRIVSVEIGEAEPTIGLEVADAHTHVTGGVVTHNTLYLGGGADVKVVGANLQQLDFQSVQGRGETRVAAAGGVPPIIVGLSEGLNASTYSNYGQAIRRFADLTMAYLWAGFCGTLQTILPPPGSDARLWYDTRDVAFLRADRKDAAEIEQTKAATIVGLVNGGFTPDSAIEAVESEDMRLLVHTNLVSVQLQPPGTVANNSNNGAAAPNTNGSGGANAMPPAGATRGWVDMTEAYERARQRAAGDPHIPAQDDVDHELLIADRHPALTNGATHG